MTETSPLDGLDRARKGVREVEEGLKDTARESYSRYRAYAIVAGDKVAAATGRGLRALDERLGDAPWAFVGLDERGVRIARKVATDLLPRTLGERTTSFVDGVALKAGIGGTGLLLRLPLKPLVVPVLGAFGVIEAVKVVRDVRSGIGDIAKDIDADADPDPL